MQDTVLGIDLGTQSLKVVFFAPHAVQVVASASAAVALDQDEQGKAEQDAGWWLAALDEAMAEISDSVKRSAKAIAVSGQQHGFVPLGGDGKVLAPVKLWCDTTTGDECEAIMASYGGAERCLAELGNPIVTGYTAPKILWLKRHRPEAYAAMSTILLPHDYLNFVLTGEVSMEYGDASGTGLLRIRERSWDLQMLRAVDSQRDLRECLPPLREADQLAGYLTKDMAARLGLEVGIPVATGGGDNMMGAIGTGNVKPGVVTVSLGSSGTVYAYSDQPVIDPGGRLAAFCASTGGWLPLLCTMNCTLSTELMRSVFDTDLPALERAVSGAEPGSGGVLCLPFFNGERTPNLPKAKGSFLGIDATNATPENFLRATMEGASFGLRLGLEALQENGVSVEEIRLTGGGSHSDSWRQMLADICNVRVVVTTPDEGAALGAALQALWALRLSTDPSASIEDIASAFVGIDEEKTCHPNAEQVKKYEAVYAEYRRATEHIGNFYQ